MLERVLVCLLADGHLLIEGVPGLAKTLTIKTTAQVLGGTFNRIQFTPDLMPSDLVGTRVYRPHDGEFDVELGPVFCNFLLADEINRAPAKVQSALLEVMQERQVTIGKETFGAPSPFLVMATQNPIESEGTYPLPEAQVDRFMLKVVVGYPGPEDELTVVERSLAGLAEVRSLIDLDELISLRGAVREVYVDPALSRYAVQIAGATRDPEAVGLPDLKALRRLRRQPPRADLADDRGPCAGAHPRTGLRPSAGRPRARHGTRCSTESSSATRRSPPRSRPSRSSTRCSRSCRSPELDLVGARGVSATALRRERTPEQPGPRPAPRRAPARARPKIGRRLDGLSRRRASHRRGRHRHGARADPRVGAWRRRAAYRLERHGAYERGPGASRRGGARLDVLGAARCLAVDEVRDRRPAQVGRRRRRRGRRRPPGVAARKPDRRRDLRRNARRSCCRPRQGRVGLLGVLLAVRRDPETERVGATSIGSALTQVARVARQRSLTVSSPTSAARGTGAHRSFGSPRATPSSPSRSEIPREQELPERRPCLAGRSRRPDAGSTSTPDGRRLRERFAETATAERDRPRARAGFARRPPRRALHRRRLASFVRRLHRERRRR